MDIMDLRNCLIIVQPWSPSKLCDINLFEDLQQNFTRRLQGMNESSFEERLVKCDRLSLELRRLQKDLAICYHIVNR